MKKSTLLTTLLAAPVLMGTSLSAATYTLSSDGYVLDNASLDSTDPDLTFTDQTNNGGTVIGLVVNNIGSGDQINVDGVNGDLQGSQNLNVDFNGATLNVTGGADLENRANKNIGNVTINIQDTSTISGGGNWKLQNSTIINYDSSATSTVNSLALFGNSSILNILQGDLVAGTNGGFLNLASGTINLDGGNLSFNQNYSLNNNTGAIGNIWNNTVIDFDSTLGSVLTFTDNASSADEFDTYITDGNLTIDGVIADINDFDRVFNEGTLTISVASVAVPEPSSTALLGLGGLAMLLRRRRG